MINSLLNLLFDYTLNYTSCTSIIYSNLSAVLGFIFCFRRWLLFQFTFLGPVGYSHVQGNGLGTSVGKSGCKF